MLEVIDVLFARRSVRDFCCKNIHCHNWYYFKNQKSVLSEKYLWGFLLFCEETAIICLNDIKQTVCILGVQCLWRETVVEVLNLIWTELRLNL